MAQASEKPMNGRSLPTQQSVGRRANPRAKREEDTRTPEQLMDIIEAKGRAD